MKREDLLKKATELGIDYDKRVKTTKLLEMVNTVSGENYTIDEPEEKKEVTTTKTPKNNETIRAIIHSGDRDNDEVEAVGCVNGETFQFQIGVEIDFPIRFLPSLSGAVIKESIAIFDDSGMPTGKTKIRKSKHSSLF